MDISVLPDQGYVWVFVAASKNGREEWTESAAENKQKGFGISQPETLTPHLASSHYKNSSERHCGPQTYRRLPLNTILNGVLRFGEPQMFIVCSHQSYSTCMTLANFRDSVHQKAKKLRNRMAGNEPPSKALASPSIQGSSQRPAAPCRHRHRQRRPRPRRR